MLGAVLARPSDPPSCSPLPVPQRISLLPRRHGSAPTDTTPIPPPLRTSPRLHLTPPTPRLQSAAARLSKPLLVSCYHKWQADWEAELRAMAELEQQTKAYALVTRHAALRDEIEERKAIHKAQLVEAERREKVCAVWCSACRRGVSTAGS